MQVKCISIDAKLDTEIDRFYNSEPKSSIDYTATLITVDSTVEISKQIVVKSNFCPFEIGKIYTITEVTQ